MVKSRYLWAGLISFAAFITLGIVVRSKPTSIDLTIAQFFMSHRTDGEIRFANILSAMTAPIIVAPLAIGLLLLWNYKKQKWSAQDFIPIVLIVATGVASTLAKTIFHRARPGIDLSTLYDAEPGFPSSHTVFVAAIGSSLLFIIAKRRLLVIAAIFVATGFMSSNRLVLGAHWLTDLLGSVLLSLSILFAALFWSQSLDAKRRNF